ncbi:MAG: murein biosynthesis integral membrane protein MurJ [Gemmatimonadaceae bacterium]|nr:murein biosynthesis integral membrane protein MurJ [Gemmatimonadaceae bacterium]
MGTGATPGSSPTDRLSRVRNTGVGAAFVATGILGSRLAGLVRQRVSAYYLGNSDAADAFAFAFRVPNVLQNLLGEGVLSASFVPVYAGLLARGDEEEAGRVAGAVAGLLAAAMSVLVLLGMLAAPVLVAVLAPGFPPEKRVLATQLVRILFPGAALLAGSAWALGILNSHGRFLWSYLAPVAWNAAMIAALLGWGGRTDQEALVRIVAWGSVAGSALQLLVQLPGVRLLCRGLRLSLDRRREGVRATFRSFAPVVAGRGVAQLSGWLDAVLASLVAPGAVAAMGYAQVLYMLPVSLFGMSVTAAELPAMASEFGADDTVAVALRGRLRTALMRVAYFVVPSAVAFLVLGEQVVALVYQGGRFTADDARWVWAILAGSAVGLVSSTMGRLYASAWYALRQPQVPMRIGLLRVGLTLVFGLVLAFPVRSSLGLEAMWGVAGLTAGAGLAAIVEFVLLRRSLAARVGDVRVPAGDLLKLWGIAGAAAGAGLGAGMLLPGPGPVVRALLVLGTYGATYLLATSAAGLGEARALLARLRRR